MKMILESLMEKKDVLAYLEFRIKHLIKQRRDVPKCTPPEMRSHAIAKIKGRIEELDHLRVLVQEDKVKDASKMHYQHVKQTRLEA